jgi:hypothetical protein
MPDQVIIQNNLAPVFKGDMEKSRFKNLSLPIINGNGNGIRHESPPPKLERITEGSISISLISDRVIRKSYGEFLNLAETYGHYKIRGGRLIRV